jgi:IclR family acetate operon transcriptional repressor
VLSFGDAAGVIVVTRARTDDRRDDSRDESDVGPTLVGGDKSGDGTSGDGTSDDGALSSVRSLDRPFVVLGVLRERRGPMRLTEIASAAQLHLATTQRIVNLLIRYGYVDRDGLDYRLGIAALLDANAYLFTNSLVRAAEVVLRELTASTGLTSTMTVRVDLSAVLLFRVPSTPPLRYQLPLGERIPLVVGGARVLAAALPPEDLDRLLDGVSSIPLASGVELSRAEFIESLRVIRERGYAFGQGQREAGSLSIAVPVIDHDGAVVASIQLSALIEDIPMDVDSLVVELKRASSAITRRIT